MKYFMGILAVSLLAGCNDKSKDPSNQTDTPQNFKTVTLDATAGGFGADDNDPDNKYTYYDFDTEAVIELTDEQAASNNVWDIAFKRSQIKLNGGASGNSAVAAALAIAQTEFYDEDNTPIADRFRQANADSELEKFESVIDSHDLTFTTDTLLPAIPSDGSDVSWWSYDPQSHQLSARSDNWYIVRSASSDRFIKFQITDVNSSDRTVTLSYFLQDAGANQFAESSQQVVLSAVSDANTPCLEFSTGETHDCDNGHWDLKLFVSDDLRQWQLWTNNELTAGGSGAAFGPVTSPDDYYSADRTQADFDYSGLYQTAKASNVFLDSPWYAYNLDEQHKLWPNYRVYVVDSTQTTYKLQLLSYYNEAGVSGMITFRFESLGE